MRDTRCWLALAVAALVAASAAAEIRGLPLDPGFCVTPVLNGDAGAPPYAMPTGARRPLFIPGHPYPVLRDISRADYFDRDGRLRAHPPDGAHDYLDVFLGSDGDVYKWAGAGRDDRRFVFDRELGHFRRLRPEEAGRHDQIEGFLAEIAAASRPQDAPSRLRGGGIAPTRSNDAGLDTADPGYLTQRRWAEIPSLPLRVETEGDTLRLAWGDRLREVTLQAPSGHWRLTELPAAGRVLFQNTRGAFFLIDEALNITRPDGDWRIAPSGSIYLPETGEVLVESGLALPYRVGLFWLRDRRVHGPEACLDPSPPPDQDWRVTEPAGATMIDTAHLSTDVRPAWTGRAFAVGGQNGAFEIPPGGPVRRIEGVPESWTEVGRVPGSALILIASCDRFFLHDGARIIYASGRLTRFFQRRCIPGLRAVGHDPATGAIGLANGWTLTADDRLDRSERPFAPAVGWQDWLAAPPNPAEWPRRESASSGRQPSWWKVPRLGFAIRQDGKGRFVRMGPDFVEVTPPGQPENPHWSLSGIGLLFDPGAGDVLAADVSGRPIRIAADGAVAPVDCPAPCALGRITAMDADPADPRAALIGAEGGLFRYVPGGAVERLLPVAATGAVFRLDTVPLLGETLVAAAFGRFVWSEERGLRRLARGRGTLGALPLFALPERGELYTSTRTPARFELVGGAADPGARR